MPLALLLRIEQRQPFEFAILSDQELTAISDFGFNKRLDGDSAPKDITYRNSELLC